MAKTTKHSKQDDSRELLEALTILEKEKNISKEVLLEAIENSLITACKNHFGKADNVKVEMNPDTCEFHVYAGKSWNGQRISWQNRSRPKSPARCGG